MRYRRFSTCSRAHRRVWQSGGAHAEDAVLRALTFCLQSCTTSGSSFLPFVTSLVSASRLPSSSAVFPRLQYYSVSGGRVNLV